MPSPKIVFALLVMSLSGCGLGTLIQEKREAKERAYISNAQEACKRYGFAENTDTFAQCAQNEVIASKARDAANAREQTSRTSTSCTKTNIGMNCTTR